MGFSLFFIGDWLKKPCQELPGHPSQKACQPEDRSVRVMGTDRGSPRMDDLRSRSLPGFLLPGGFRVP